MHFPTRAVGMIEHVKSKGIWGAIIYMACLAWLLKAIKLLPYY